MICGRENMLAVMGPTERAGEPSPEGDADGPAHGAVRAGLGRGTHASVTWHCASCRALRSLSCAGRRDSTGATAEGSVSWLHDSPVQLHSCDMLAISATQSP